MKPFLVIGFSVAFLLFKIVSNLKRLISKYVKIFFLIGLEFSKVWDRDEPNSESQCVGRISDFFLYFSLAKGGWSFWLIFSHFLSFS